MESGLLALKWNNHKKTFFKTLSKFRSESIHTDVTLACGNNYFNVHKVVLSSCSEYFEELFSKTHCKCPVIVLKDIRPADVEALLNYMYLGEVEVKQEELPQLIKAAECLQIKGLASNDEDEEDKKEERRKRKRNEEPDRQLKRHSKSSFKNQTFETNSSEDSKTFGTSTLKNQKYERNPNENSEAFELILPEISPLPEIKTEPPYDEGIIEVTKEEQFFPKESESYAEEEMVDDNFIYDAESVPEPSFNEDQLENPLDEAVPSTPAEGESPGSGLFTEEDFIEGTLNTKIFRCNFCSHSSYVLSKAKRHSRVHTGEKPFKCDYCDYRSTHKDAVKRHMRIHTGNKPYKCQFCDYHAVQKRSVHLHIARNHVQTE